MSLKEQMTPKTRREQIIESALLIFNEKGFTNTKMSEICKKAKASTGSVYHHFKNKDQLASAIYIEGIKEYQNNLLKDFVNTTDGYEGVRNCIANHLNWVENNTEWSRFLFQKRHAEFMNESLEEFNELNIKFASVISKWFVKRVREGSIRKMNWDIYIAILLGPCQEFTRLYLAGITGSAIEVVIDELSRAVWQGLKA